MVSMHVSARVDYALRAAVELAAAPDGSAVKRETIADAQAIPINYLEQVLFKLRNAGIVMSRRGFEGGYWLNRPAEQITIADVVRAIDGSLTTVRGEPPSAGGFPGVAKPLRAVWIAVDVTTQSTLDSVTLADVVTNRLPPAMTHPAPASNRAPA